MLRYWARFQIGAVSTENSPGVEVYPQTACLTPQKLNPKRRYSVRFRVSRDAIGLTSSRASFLGEEPPKQCKDRLERAAW
jgi:hypothetical protein